MTGKSYSVAYRATEVGKIPRVSVRNYIIRTALRCNVSLTVDFLISYCEVRLNKTV